MSHEFDPEAIDQLAELLRGKGFVVSESTNETPEGVEEIAADETPEIIETPPAEETKTPPVEEMDRGTWLKFVSGHLEECPECYNDLYKAVYKGDLECKDCALPLGSPEHAKALESCPECGSKGARKR